MARIARWGVTLPIQGHPLTEQRPVISELADLGYTDAWSAELNGTDAFTPLVLASQWATGLRLGTAIAPIYTRGPALLAMTAATLADLAPGRFVLGIGASTPVVVEQWNAIPFEAPYRRSRDLLRFLRAALSGEKVTRDYSTFEVSGFRLANPPKVPPGLALAALRPQMLALAAAEAGAAITNWLAPADVPQVRAVIGDDCELIARIFVCPTTDAAAARAIARRVLTGYLTVPAYAAFHQWLGRGEVLEPMLRAWNSGDRAGATAAIPDAVVDDLVIHGDVGYCRERVQAYREASMDTPVIMVIPAPGVNLADAVRHLAPG